ncbi:SPV040 hypothetical protein [Swinepox virus]|uniref:Uncharacterized protein n=2 Tax=Swinepox virus TaxID=10276 RepID=Q8V3Q4_SWPV1|nr:SPV040 hypothetical protein [Swinepox virus]AAL69779.1 SPV040 hypothetical protein [Swinepox virus]QQG31530.1 hypothetical protein [Swinepox virus]UED36678.1 SPV040 hypothetical protein [Swinepox virus]UED36826.1 SPV040 hypothetical protein [Swinepox virus]UUA44230.1 SPV040 [Swinepox virus]
MDKLYAAIFGVFMTSKDDDFNNFIEVVKSVLTDTSSNHTISSSNNNTWIYIFLAILFGVMVLLVFILYLKVTKPT